MLSMLVGMKDSIVKYLINDLAACQDKKKIKVVTIVKLPNSEFPKGWKPNMTSELLIAARDVKEMREDLKKIARESSRPGVDYRFTFAPVEVRSFNGSV